MKQVKNYKVVIPCAGTGSRIGPYTKFINKALITIDNRPAITHIIDKFSPDVEIVILLGHKGEYIWQVLKAFYPNRLFTFVQVDKFEGPGTGLGYSLNCAKEVLQCPFIFVSNDTIIPDEPIDIDPIIGNWMGYYNSKEDTSQYRTLNIKNDVVTRINPKGVLESSVYVGVAGILDYEQFWMAMEDPEAIEAGESYGLKSLNKIRALPMPSWCDTGNMTSLEKTKARFGKNPYNILEKESEAIWFTKDRVIKFSVDNKFIADRVARTKELPPELLPQIQAWDKNLYVYKKAEGRILSDVIDVPTFAKVFDTVNNRLWQVDVRPVTDEMAKICEAFYKTKTYERVDLFHRRFEVLDKEEVINGVSVPKTQELLDAVNWIDVCQRPHMSRFHGDFHNENILVNGDNIVLLDWRQNFGSGNLRHGDAYYDLAKFYHGLIVSHKMIHDGHFSVDVNEHGHIRIDVLRPQSLIDVEKAFLLWLDQSGYDSRKVMILTALIFLNICGLHDYPYSLFLYYLGKSMLNEILNSK